MRAILILIEAAQLIAAVFYSAMIFLSLDGVVHMQAIIILGMIGASALLSASLLSLSYWFFARRG